MVFPSELQFNPAVPTTMHLDLNSCFASIEQQANHQLRGKAIAVAAYKTDSGCILAPSVEAKRLGIKVGMRVKEARLLCPGIVVLEPDPEKYRFVHKKLRAIVSSYSDKFTPKSIDEFVIDFRQSPFFFSEQRRLLGSAEKLLSKVPSSQCEDWYQAARLAMISIARQIKGRMHSELGEYIMASVGLAPNRFLAKLAAGLHKPNGLDVVDKDNYADTYNKLGLYDLCGIKLGNATRLNGAGIFTVPDFYRAPAKKLNKAFKSVVGYYWYLRLRGWEIDDIDFERRSFGNSIALGEHIVELEVLAPFLMRLVEKSMSRLRRAGYLAGGLHVAVTYRNGSFWHKSSALDMPITSTVDAYRGALRLLTHSGLGFYGPVRILAFSCFNLSKQGTKQLSMFSDRRNVYEAVDKVNDRWGAFVLGQGSGFLTENKIRDRISFGGVRELF